MSSKKTQIEIFNRLKILRKSWELTQKNMAARIEIAVSTYQYYERGERDIPSRVLHRITTFGVNPNWLLTGEGEIFCINEQEASTPQTFTDEDEDSYRGIWHRTYVQRLPDAIKSLSLSAFERLSRIYSSGNQALIRAINSNLEAFSEALSEKEQIIELKSRITALEDQVKTWIQNDRRKGQRRRKDLEPPGGEDRRTGTDRRMVKTA